jgi:hypothetical protein
MIQGLPADSALVRKLSGGWSDDRELAAAQVEILHAIYRATLAAGGMKQLPPPLRIPRPNQYNAGPQKRLATKSEAVDFFTRR